MAVRRRRRGSGGRAARLVDVRRLAPGNQPAAASAATRVEEATPRPSALSEPVTDFEIEKPGPGSDANVARKGRPPVRRASWFRPTSPPLPLRPAPTLNLNALTFYTWIQYV